MGHGVIHEVPHPRNDRGRAAAAKGQPALLTWSVLMKAVLVVLSLAAIVQAPAVHGTDFETMRLAHELGEVLGSEEACGFSFDQAAIASFVEERVPPDAMGFTSSLSAATRSTERQLPSFSASATTAHCTQVRRVAVSYGFLAE